MYIDAHAHLHDADFDADREEVFHRAISSGVKKMLFVGTNIQESRKAVALAAKYDGMYAAVGLHPHVFNEKSFSHSFETSLKELEILIQDKKVAAVGEIGLDYHSHTDTPITEEQKRFQTEGFLQQMALACRFAIPAVIHCREAYNDLYCELVSKYADRLLVLHCYQGDVEVTKKFLELPQIFFSFSGSITYPVKKVLRGTNGDSLDVVRAVPLERILSETDCPYLAPQPVRGLRNEPAHVKYVTEKIAEVHGVSVNEVARAIEKNFHEIFSKC